MRCSVFDNSSILFEYYIHSIYYVHVYTCVLCTMIKPLCIPAHAKTQESTHTNLRLRALRAHALKNHALGAHLTFHAEHTHTQKPYHARAMHTRKSCRRARVCTTKVCKKFPFAERAAQREACRLLAGQTMLGVTQAVRAYTRMI